MCNFHFSLLFLLFLLTAPELFSQQKPGTNLPGVVNKKPGLDSGFYQDIKDGLTNSYLKFTKDKTGRVAFLGGSITQNPGWREMICKYLTERFPETKLDFVNAGIGSTGSTPSDWHRMFLPEEKLICFLRKRQSTTEPTHLIQPHVSGAWRESFLTREVQDPFLISC